MSTHSIAMKTVAIQSVVSIVTIMMVIAVAPQAFAQTTASQTGDASPQQKLLTVTGDPATLQSDEEDHRLWLISTRHLTSSVCRVQLDEPNFRVWRLSECGRRTPSSLEQYFASLSPDRPLIVYTHGNRIEASAAINRGLKVYHYTIKRCSLGPVDWVLFSWPSEQRGILIHDVREKARRTDAQGLYLGWLLRRHSEASVHTSLIGYSFGGRIVTGGLHAMAGGTLRGRALPGDAVTGANIDAALVAPAIESNWMSSRGYHRHATKNLDQLLLLYNRRDAVLKQYWRLERIKSSVALGYTGPRSFAPRVDGSKLPVRSRDCSRYLGLAHVELDYYTKGCGAGREMATMINDAFTNH